ncbi:ferritin-like domain-containing protein [Thiohalobacter sp. IOR34]|uniref:ferritin-like domain-containing protein n=1 Tax=Thiohalobacter sp. IOR34 TaxID=3057176 RepID=UPI0025B105F7|nr:ferritin-like domain-containing protein [Thiohalobacter sp. IOR34]WJW74506.1 ferritin-like domain-containing protein [Thiohalobacter sp. IOR34]
MNAPADALQSDDLFDAARAALAAGDAEQKCRLTLAAWEALAAGRLRLRPSQAGASLDAPGRPPRPELVAPRDLPRRRLSSVAGRAALLHAIAHIEFNAINLAWDAVCRFPDMPEAFYRDWARVAAEEATHFRLLRERLQALDHDYGDFPAHNGLWQAALDTRHDVLLRMALVPRVLEARGLDVTPGIMQRLRRAGDEASVAVLEVILREEIGHVEIGSRWFHYCCRERGLPPAATFRRLLEAHMAGRIRGPFHYEARSRAGFTAEELALLDALDTAAHPGEER